MCPCLSLVKSGPPLMRRPWLKIRIPVCRDTSYMMYTAMDLNGNEVLLPGHTSFCLPRSQPIKWVNQMCLHERPCKAWKAVLECLVMSNVRKCISQTLNFSWTHAVSVYCNSLHLNDWRKCPLPPRVYCLWLKLLIFVKWTLTENLEADRQIQANM